MKRSREIKIPKLHWNLFYTFLLDASEARLFRDTAYSAENSVLSVHVMNWREHVMKTLVRQ